MTAWPQIVRVRKRETYPWPCLRCANLSWAITVLDKSGGKCHVADECSAIGHNGVVIASLDANDCDDFTPRGGKQG